MSEMSEGYLSRAQFDRLVSGVNPARVSKDDKGFSHLEAYHVRVTLNRIFGYGRWSATTMLCDLVFETETPSKMAGNGSRWTVCYKAKVCLSVNSPYGSPLASYTEYAVGDAANQPSRAYAHDFAMKTAESQALKRCAVNFGDQFGLSLYNKGSLEPVVGGSLVVPGSLEFARKLHQQMQGVLENSGHVANDQVAAVPDPGVEDGEVLLFDIPGARLAGEG